VRVVEARSTTEQDGSDERERELRSLRQQHSQQQQIIQSQTSRLAEKDKTIVRKEQQKVQTLRKTNETIAQKDEIIAELREQTRQIEKEKGVVVEEKERELRQKVEEIDGLERQLGRVNQQLEESERVIAQFQRRIAELEQLRPATDASSSSKEQRTSIKLTWREGEKAPCKMDGSYNSAVNRSTLYVLVACQAFCYTHSTSSWSQLPDSPTYSCPAVIINNLLTLVGGRGWSTDTITNQLFSLTGEGSGRGWTEEFPPMPTRRYGMTALCAEVALIVAGGERRKGMSFEFEPSILQTVEVLNTETLQWSTAADLPRLLSYTPASVCGDQIYIPGVSNTYTCSLQSLLRSSKKSFLANFRNRGARVWKEVAAPPVTETTCVSIHTQLLTIGGKDSNREPTSAVHMYNPTTDSWEVISHMGTPRYNCIAAVLPNNQLMVVGGYLGHVSTDSVEFASIV
jgi:hypothetical protein